MSAVMIVIASVMVIAMFRMAAAGKPLHDDFADKAAIVDGEMVDVISNMPLVRAFCGLAHEHQRFDATVDRELVARGRSLRYLEKLRLTHAAVTVALIIALLAWGIRLWEQGGATTGDVVLICTLGLSILNATRDLAVALVDVTQHVARMTEAISTLLQPHELRDHPAAEPLVRAGAAIAFNNISFQYPGGQQVFDRFSLRLYPGQRVGLADQPDALPRLQPQAEAFEHLAPAGILEADIVEDNRRAAPHQRFGFRMIAQFVRQEQRRNRLGEPRHMLGDVDERHGQISRGIENGQAERTDQHDVAGRGSALLPEHDDPGEQRNRQ